MKKIQSIYSFKDFQIIVNEEYPHISIVEFGEACSGILKHWGSPDEIIKKLESAIKAVKDIKDYLQ